MTMSRSSQAFAGGGVEHRDAEERQTDSYEKKIEHRNLLRAGCEPRERSDAPGGDQRSRGKAGAFHKNSIKTLRSAFGSLVTIPLIPMQASGLRKRFLPQNNTPSAFSQEPARP
ncbi:MAG: hypothetical protein ABSD21_02710 [Rhizomicrobium sp.]|jgi:hypothetical protein